MYVYQITNLINSKIYIGITNDYIKRWSNHRCCNSPNMVIARAIKKYGVENFKFEILLSGLSVEEADEKEEELIIEKNCRVPYGYNVARGGSHNAGVSLYGADNHNAKLTEEQAQYIKDHRDIPMYVLYEDYNDLITYETFKKIYNGITYKNLTSSVDPYPYNLEFSSQFTGNNKLTYGQVVYLREQYARGRFWKDVYKEYQDIYSDPYTFWNIYVGNRYRLVMPEVFTEENKKKHASLSKSGERNGRAKLTEQDVKRIRYLHSTGASNQEIYEQYPQVTKTSVRDIINNKTWRNLL